MSKKFINKKEDVVRESLKGLQMIMHKSLDLIYEESENNNEIPMVCVKEEVILKKKVKIICGGGSGHEPAHAGYVCPQMLAGAVCGQVFASPSVAQVKRTLQYVIQEQKDVQILVIIKNYTGDLINFLTGVCQIKQEYRHLNVEIETLQVGDDIALLDQMEGKKVEARGVAGTALLYKILGAAAYQGNSLKEVKALGEQILNRLTSLGVCLESCGLPGAGKSHQVGEGFMEVGMGIHGEQGRGQVSFEGVGQVVKGMVHELVRNRQGELIVMINNLGGVSQLEMGVIVKEVMHSLNSLQGVKVVRLIAGQVMTSIDMQGFSLSLLWLDHLDLLSLLDLEVDSQFWPKAINTEGDIKRVILNRKKKEYKECLVKESDQLREGLKVCLNRMILKEGEFNQMDGEVGDGDMGWGVSRASQQVLAVLHCLDTDSHLKDSLLIISDIVSDAFGGTSGPLWGVFIGQCADSLNQKYNDNRQQQWVEGYKGGVKGVQQVGGADEGDRTMVDALLAGSTYLNNHLNNHLTLHGLAQAIHQGAINARQFSPKKGRSAYLDHHKVIGFPEPGCELAASIFQQMAEQLAERESQI